MNHFEDFDSRVTLQYPMLDAKWWRGYWPEVQVLRIG
jgi:hypothetical protein